MKMLWAGEGSGVPLKADELQRRVVRPGSVWRELRVVAETGSTNADLLAEARTGAPEGLVLVAEQQTAGRGRLGREWVSRPGAGLTFSVLLRPAGVPPALLGWLPLLAGVAAVAAVREVAGVSARLKWPNDLMVGERKLAGILAEAWGDAIVLGIGLNVGQRRADLPGPAATSLLLEAAAGRPGKLAARRPEGELEPPPHAEEAAPGRGRVLTALLGELARWYAAWREQDRPGDPDGCGLREAYQRDCATLRREVTALLPGGQAVTGTAVGVDVAGRLEVRTEPGLVAVSAGDVVHLR